MKSPINFGVVIILLVSCAFSSASELAVLRNGNEIRHERHQVVGTITRLYLGDSAAGYIEIPTDQIERFEFDKTVVEPAAPKMTSSAPLNSSHAPVAASARPLEAKEQRVIDRQSLDAMVNGAGQRHQIDPDFINSVIRAESGFNNLAVSRKGAQGLMQLMPQTASDLGVANSFDPNSNVEGGTKYLRELLEKYNYDVPKALAAYNAGSHRVDQYHGVPPYFETQAYVARIIRDFNRQKIAENPSLAHQGKTTARHSQTAKSSTSKTIVRKAAAKNSSVTETASR